MGSAGTSDAQPGLGLGRTRRPFGTPVGPLTGGGMSPLSQLPGGGMSPLGGGTPLIGSTNPLGQLRGGGMSPLNQLPGGGMSPLSQLSGGGMSPLNKTQPNSLLVPPGGFDAPTPADAIADFNAPTPIGPPNLGKNQTPAGGQNLNLQLQGLLNMFNKRGGF